MIPFYYRIIEVPLDPQGNEYYDFTLIFGEGDYWEKEVSKYLTADREEVRFKVNIGYCINIYNAEAVYRKYRTVDPQAINLQIFQSINSRIARSTGEHSVWLLTKGLGYFEVGRIVEERMKNDRALGYSSQNGYFESAHGSLMSINVRALSREEINEAYQEEMRRLQFDDLPLRQPHIDIF